MSDHAVVSHDEWLEARKQLLDAEKEFTRRRDELTRRRLELPWEAVEKPYTFTGPGGDVSLADLFDGRSQLLVYHFMFDPGDEVGCPICSFWADNFDPIVLHLRARDVTMVAVSQAPFAKIAAYKERMGWSFPWFSSFGSDFNFDYGVSFRPEQADEPLYNYGTLPPRDTQREGLSVFSKDGRGRIFHTYSAYARGIDLVTPRTTTSTSSRRDVTRTAAAPTGSAATTNTARAQPGIKRGSWQGTAQSRPLM